MTEGKRESWEAIYHRELWPPIQTLWVMRLLCGLLLVPLEHFWFLQAPNPGPQCLLDCVVRENLDNSSNSLVVGSAGLNQRTIFLNQNIVAATSQKKPLLIRSAENWKMQSAKSFFGLKKNLTQPLWVILSLSRLVVWVVLDPAPTTSTSAPEGVL